MKLFFAIFSTVCWATATAQTGQVVGVHDGDTLTLLVENHQIKVRLAGIDAPELRQAFGTRSRESLAQLCFDHTATLSHTSKDRYGRTVADVDCDGAQANSEQVRRGMAWVYTRYVRPNSPLYPLESAARAQHLGLWTDADPAPPWDFRHPK